MAFARNILRWSAYLANRLNGSVPASAGAARAGGLSPGDYLQAQRPLVR